MPELSRSQLIVYAAIAVAVLLLGARWLRSSEAAPPGSPLAGDEVAAVGSGGSGSGSSFEVDSGGGALVVHVAGAVRDPGVYRLPEGSRVMDALERAGGASADGAPDSINLAATVADGQQVVVPPRAGSPGAAGGLAAATADAPISLSTATVEELDTIEGIGPVTAADILEFRDERGGLSSIDELDEISGIGPATMESLRDGLQP